MYQTKLNIQQTQRAIEKIKIHFPSLLSKALKLTRVTAPLFLDPKTGLNDGLSGEKAVNFTTKHSPKKIEIVHSLAKWKRFALAKYKFKMNHGLYTDMNAIRREEILSNLHSFYVDHWDWELIIDRSQRNVNFLKAVVTKIYEQIKILEQKINTYYPQLTTKLPQELVFITSQELEDLYPNLSPKERENKFAKEQAKAFFILEIGYPLKSKMVHSQRAIDYDDWTLNGDLIFYDYQNDAAIEISSMGIRVDRLALINQSKLPEQKINKISHFHKQILQESLPFSIGGGIGQSRLSMFLLEKKHIGEVQVSYWPEKIRKAAKKEGISLL